jgi:hypothetical protein
LAALPTVSQLSGAVGIVLSSPWLGVGRQTPGCGFRLIPLRDFESSESEVQCFVSAPWRIVE